MKHFTRHIITLLLAFSVAFASIGITIHNCLCCEPVACHQAAKKCCSAPKPNPKHCSGADDNCPPNETQYKKLDLEYALSYKSVAAKTLHPLPADADQPALLPNLGLPTQATVVTAHHIGFQHHAPPPPHGRQRLQWIQVWRI